MIDPILSLSFSMHSNKGVYALLLGSGISRAAGIPTGWEVTLELIRKLAHVKNENCEPDPTQWYKKTFAEEADYSKVLNLLAKTPSERSQLLKGYFEPTEEERQQKLKIPTEAHKAIANLVVKGLVKVIVTTNFDRLMEKALEEVGVFPIVISTTDTALGAPPIVHTSCTLIKVHGDYLDTRIKNTPEELSNYDKSLNKLLDRIFDEFGLIICGWSGEWDIALRKSILRSKSRRFTAYWTLKDPLSEKAKELVDFRKAEIINIQSADSFFFELSEKLTAISEFERPHPLSAQIAAATVERYLVNENDKIRLHNLIVQEVEKLHGNLSTEYFSTGSQFTLDELQRRIQRYESLVEVLQAMVIINGYWGNEKSGNLYMKGLERLSDCLIERFNGNAWDRLRLYPSLLILYSAGLAALAGRNYDMLASVLIKPQHKSQTGESEPLVLSLSPQQVMDIGIGRQLPNLKGAYFPLSEHLFEILAEPLKGFLPDKNEFDSTFDRLEFFCALITADFNLQFQPSRWIPVGRFGWKYRNGGMHISKRIQQEIERDGERWLPLKSGFFGGSLERVVKALEEVMIFLKTPTNYLLG